MYELYIDGVLFPVTPGSLNIKINNKNPVVVPQEIGRLQIPVRDPHGAQGIEQHQQAVCLGLSGWRLGRQVLQQVFPRAERIDQKGTAAYRADAFLA